MRLYNMLTIPHLLEKHVAFFSTLLLLFIVSPTCLLADQQDLARYKLGVGDKIKIIVHGEEDLTLETKLSDSGGFKYPFLGDVQAAGLSLEQLNQVLVSGLKPDYLLQPDINIFIVEYRGFFIHGEIKKPGNYPYQPGLTLEKAIALAGGFTERASKTRIYRLSENDKQVAEQKIDLEVKIQPGDIVNIKQSFF